MSKRKLMTGVSVCCAAAVADLATGGTVTLATALTAAGSSLLGSAQDAGSSVIDDQVRQWLDGAPSAAKDLEQVTGAAIASVLKQVAENEDHDALRQLARGAQGAWTKLEGYRTGQRVSEDEATGAATGDAFLSEAEWRRIVDDLCTVHFGGKNKGRVVSQSARAAAAEALQDHFPEHFHTALTEHHEGPAYAGVVLSLLQDIHRAVQSANGDLPDGDRNKLVAATESIRNDVKQLLNEQYADLDATQRKRYDRLLGELDELRKKTLDGVQQITDAQTETLTGAIHGAEQRLHKAIGARSEPASSSLPKLKPGTQTDFFVGRVDVMEEVEDAFPEEHFVYVYGPGGIGKSTLVRKLFKNLDEADWTGGAQYLDLATADSGSAVLDRIVQQLSLPGNVRDGASLATHLAQRPQKLYVLDDIEQALAGDEADGTSTTLSLLRNLESPNVGVHFLVTCRSKVNVGHGLEVEPLTDDEPAELFKTTATHKGYTWTDGDDEALATFIPELGGHPLSIDIAARVAQNYASVAALSEAWTTRRTEILEVHPAFGSPDKNDSLHTSIDLSYHALPDDARGTLARQIFALLADLPAGAGLDFLREVFDDDPTHAARLLERRSLVTCEDNRFRLLAPIRYYAERTQDSDHVTRHKERRERMESVLLTRVEELFDGRHWPDVPRTTKEEIVIEADNVEAAVERAAGEDNHRVLIATNALNSYYASNRHLDRSVRAFKQQLDAAGGLEETASEAEAIFQLGRIALYRDDPSSARDHLTRARDLYRDLDNRLGETNALLQLGTLDLRQGRPTDARNRLIRARDLYRQVHDRLGEANALLQLGTLDRLHDRPTDARDHLTRARDLFRQVHNRLGEANALLQLGILDRNTGEIESARKRLRRAIEIYREIQSAWGEGLAVDALADLERQEGNDEAATDLYREALQLFRTSKNRTREAFALKDLGEMAVAREDQETAIAHFAAASELFSKVGRLDSAARCSSRVLSLAPGFDTATLSEEWQNWIEMWLPEPEDLSNE